MGNNMTKIIGKCYCVGCETTLTLDENSLGDLLDGWAVTMRCPKCQRLLYITHQLGNYTIEDITDKEKEV